MGSGAPPRDPGPEATLREVLAFDEEGALRLLLAPGGVDVEVRGVSFGDEAPRSRAGHLVLAVGASAGRAEAAGAVERAAFSGASAVVLREAEEESGPGPAPDVLAAADRSGIALLVRAAWTDWTDTAALLRSALDYHRAARTGQARGADATGEATPGTAGDVPGRGGLECGGTEEAGPRGGGPGEGADPAAGGSDGPAGALAALAASIAEATGGSITIEDTRFRVLAHSATRPEADGVRRSTILGGRVPEWRVAELRRSGLLRTLWTSREVIHRPADGDSPERLVIAVRSGAELLGSIWAAADGRPLSPEAGRALRRGAVVAARHLLGQRLRESGAVRRRDHALRGLLYGEGDRRTHAWSLGLAPYAPCAVLAVAPVAAGPDAARTLDVLALHARAYRPSVLVLREPDRLLVLLPVPAGLPPEAREREALAPARELERVAAALPGGVPVRAGVGRVAGSAAEAAEACTEAALVVRVLRDRERRARGGGAPARFASAGAVGPALDVLRMAEAVRPLWESGDGPVHRLARSDRAAGGELLRSAAAYLDAAGDVAEAARRLVLHPNTLRYRLRRLRERYDVDVDDPDTRVLLTLAVRLTGDV
ncbi:helix-turn-helix domain-containing protein [Streptomyces sp. NPDC088729]|uniref:helix-turn-helix domain-containing protein n=1 Tax=Streptomyces sp. NPDC088729 TaxID=3365876 RepID=UPI0037F35482